MNFFFNLECSKSFLMLGTIFLALEQIFSQQWMKTVKLLTLTVIAETPNIPQSTFQLVHWTQLPVSSHIGSQVQSPVVQQACELPTIPPHPPVPALMIVAHTQKVHVSPAIVSHVQIQGHLGGKSQVEAVGLLHPSGEQMKNSALMGRAAEITTTVACLSKCWFQERNRQTKEGEESAIFDTVK